MLAAAMDIRRAAMHAPGLGGCRRPWRLSSRRAWTGPVVGTVQTALIPLSLRRRSWLRAQVPPLVGRRAASDQVVRVRRLGDRGRDAGARPDHRGPARRVPGARAAAPGRGGHRGHEVSPVRHRRRDQQGACLRRAGGVHHRCVRPRRRRDRVGRGGAGEHRVEPRSGTVDPRQPRSSRSRSSPCGSGWSTWPTGWSTGQRATPYEMLSAFSAQMGEAYATEDLLPRLAMMLAEGTAAAQAHVWLRHGDELRPAASWPPDAAPPVPAGLDGAFATGAAGAAGSQLALVRHQGEVLGALSVVRLRDEPFTPAQDKLLGELAAQARPRAAERAPHRRARRQARRAQRVTAADRDSAGPGAAEDPARHRRRRAARADRPDREAPRRRGDGGPLGPWTAAHDDRQPQSRPRQHRRVGQGNWPAVSTRRCSQTRDSPRRSGPKPRGLAARCWSPRTGSAGTTGT